jgi:hypothetical protein
MLSFIKKNVFVILLVIITLAICGLNYTPGTWLTGWDTLHPEFNFSLNFQRLFNGVWRAEQGLGAVAGHSHMADLPRVVILWLFHFILPLSFLRYSYIFLCLILGPLGIYFFLEKIIFSRLKEKQVFAFLGALFYLFNLGTVQHFFVPFEMFATQYAALGWLFLLATQYLEKPQKKTLIYFSLVTFLATPQAYAATLWYVYLALILTYLLTWLIINHFKNLRQILILVSATLIINSFWLLPNLYYVFQHSGEVLQAKINQLFSEEAFLHNYEYGNLQNVALLKNHLFSWTQFNFHTGNFDLLLKSWVNYLYHPFISGLGYLFFFLVVFGLVISLIKKEKVLWPLIPVFLLAFIFLISATWPFNYLFGFLREFSLFKEALRFPFTKFSLILMFAYAVFFAWGLNWFYQFTNKFLKKKIIFFWSFVSLIALSLVIFAWPMFKGQLIDQRLKVKIPEEYFQAFDWFQKQDEGRILQLPMPTLWGWEYFDWSDQGSKQGFQGAGFAWFGLKQPFLTRDFDRWNLKNEKAYQELSYALYSRDLMFLENLLAKYQIRWLWLDKTMISPEQKNNVLFFEETEKLLSSSAKIKLAKEFNFLKIYHFDTSMYEDKMYIDLIDYENPPEDLKQKAIEKEKAYGKIELANFSERPSKVYDFNFKNLDLEPSLCGPSLENQTFGLNINGEKSLTLKSQNAEACVKISLGKIIKQRPVGDFLLQASFESENKKPFLCLAKFGTGDCLAGEKENYNYFYQFPANRELKNYEIRIILNQNGESLFKNLQFKVYAAKNKLQPEIVDNLDLSGKNTEYVSLREEKRDTFAFPELSHNQSYALMMEAENITGLPLRVCLTNYTSERCDLYANLKNGRNIFFIPVSDKGGRGYDVNLSNYAIGHIPSTNSLTSIKIIPLDYEFIKWEKADKKIITNNQSYEKNWRAFEYQGGLKIKSLGEPVMVNGWENGWLLKEETKGQTVFFFLPQLLEYFGFFLILVLIVLLAAF